MLQSQELTSALHKWAEVFMKRSMRDHRKFMCETGLSLTQLGTLMYLYHHHSCGVSQIADYLGITNAAASQMIQRLVEQTLIARTEDPNDRRAKLLTLTNNGHTLISQGIEARRHWLENLTIALSPEQQANIITALSDLTEAATKMDEQG